MNALFRFPSPRTEAKFQQLLARTILLPIGLMLVLTLSLLWQINYLFSMTQLVERTDQVRYKILETQQLAVDMQTGIRGYLLSNEPIYLQPYLDAEKKIDENFTVMQQLLVGHPRQEARLKELQRRVELWQVYAKQMLDLRSDGGSTYLDTKVLASGNNRMDSIRQLIKAMLLEEQVIRANRSRDVRFIIPLAVGSSIGIALVFGSVLAFLTRRELLKLSEQYEMVLAKTYAQADRLQQNEAEFRSLAEASPQFIWTARPDGILDYCNQRWYDYSHLTPDTLGDWPSTLHPNDVEQCADRWQVSVTTGQPYEMEFRLRRGLDGAYLWHLTRAVPMYDKGGRIIKWFGTITEIDEQKRNTQLLQQQTVELKRINYDLTLAGISLEKRNRDLDQFTYVISHDLKAPLRAISNLSQWIGEDLETVLTEDTRKQMNLLRGRVQRMEDLINGLLQYSRIGRVTTQVQRIDVTNLVTDVVDTLAPPPGFTVRIAPNLPTVKTELVLLQQVFANLLSNAIKHHHRSSGMITVTGKIVDRYAEFAVTDDGPGIDPHFHDKIFVIFQTLQSRDTLESTGIGLALVKKIVEEQSGKIWVQSQLGAGTAFYFTWPIGELDV